MQPLPAVQNAFLAHLPGWVKVFGFRGRCRQLGASKELNAGLLEIRMKVNFVQLNASGKGFLDCLSDTASTACHSVCSTTNTFNNITIRNLLTLGTSVFADVREKATTAGEVASSVAVNLFKSVVGGCDNNSSTELKRLIVKVTQRVTGQHSVARIFFNQTQDCGWATNS